MFFVKTPRVQMKDNLIHSCFLHRVDLLFCKFYKRMHGYHMYKTFHKTPKKAQLEAFRYSVKYISSCVVDAISCKKSIPEKVQGIFMGLIIFIEYFNHV